MMLNCSEPDEHSNLNDGLGEGVSYRGQILIAIKTEISDSIDTAPSEVEVEPTQSINEVKLLFASLQHSALLMRLLPVLQFNLHGEEKFE